MDDFFDDSGDSDGDLELGGDDSDIPTISADDTPTGSAPSTSNGSLLSSLFGLTGSALSAASSAFGSDQAANAAEANDRAIEANDELAAMTSPASVLSNLTASMTSTDWLMVGGLLLAVMLIGKK